MMKFLQAPKADIVVRIHPISGLGNSVRLIEAEMEDRLAGKMCHLEGPAKDYIKLCKAISFQIASYLIGLRFTNNRKTVAQELGCPVFDVKTTK